MHPPKWNEDVFADARAEDKAFQKAIGKFVLTWSEAEAALYSVLCFYAGVSDQVARAIFSGTRAGPMMSFVEAIAHNTAMESARRDDLAEIFAQLKAINTMRDRLIHNVNGSEQASETKDSAKRLLTNARRVSRLGSEFVLHVGAADINAMSADAAACCPRLFAHTDRSNDPFKAHHLKQRAWLYTPPQPNVTKMRSGPSPQRSPRRQKSSPAK